MSIRLYLVLGWMVAGLQILAAGQNPASQSLPAQETGGADARQAPAAALSALAGMQPESGADDTFGNLPQIPALLGGIGISPALLSELQRSNYLRGGVNVGAAYDDKPLFFSPSTVGNGTISIFPNLKIDHTSPRVHWTLGYAGGLTVNQRFTSQNQGSHSANFDSQYRLSQHVNLRVAENFSLTTGFFDTGNGDGMTGAGGPNESLITPLATQRTNSTTVETNYHFALKDLIGASGSLYDLHFTNPSPGAQLANSQTASASAFWLHQIFCGDWGGVTYRFERIAFSPGSGETRVHSFYAMDTLNLSSRFTLTGFIGPQYSNNEGLAPGALLPAKSDAWTLAGGAEGGWKNLNTSVSAGYSRMISDGGGVLGSVRLQSVYANFRRELAPGWAVALTASHGRNHALIGPSVASASSINATSAGIVLERNVGKSIGLRLGYTHDFQQQFGLPAPTPTLDAHRNRVFVTLSYQWAKPLGM